MNCVLRFSTIALISNLFFFACQEEAQKEVKGVNKLVEESEGSFPQTMEQTKEFQEEVKKLNIEIKQESQQRIKEINRELEEEKRR